MFEVNNIKFLSVQHKRNYEKLISRMKSEDEYHSPLAYLFSLNSDCFNHVNDLFDFEDDCIKLDGLNKAWQTSTSLQTVRLAFNLWNFNCFYNDDGEVDANFCVSNIFGCTYVEYFCEAVKLRYPFHY